MVIHFAKVVITNMNGFFCIIAIIAIVYCLSSPVRDKQKIPYLCICAILLFCSCFRNVDVGIDTPVYVEYFHRFRELSWQESLTWHFEPGYIALNKIIGFFSSDPQVFLAVLSIWVLIPIFVLIWQKSEDPLLSIFVFVVVQNWYSTFAALRQWCAIAVLIWGYRYIVDRKFVRFLVVTAIAYSFHQSALFIIPMYFLYSFRITRQKILLCLMVAGIMLVFSDQVMSVLNLFARLETEVETGGGLTMLIVLWTIVMLIDLFAYPIENEKNMKLNYIALLYSAVVQPLCLKYGPFARIHLYCWFGLELGIPGLAQYMSRTYNVRDTYLLKFLVTAVLLIWYGVTYNGRVYTFMWQ